MEVARKEYFSSLLDKNQFTEMTDYTKTIVYVTSKSKS